MKIESDSGSPLELLGRNDYGRPEVNLCLPCLSGQRKFPQLHVVEPRIVGADDNDVNDVESNGFLKKDLGDEVVCPQDRGRGKS